MSEIIAIEITDEEIALLCKAREESVKYGFGWRIVDSLIRKAYDALPETAVQ